MNIEKRTQTLAVYQAVKHGWQSVLPYSEGEKDNEDYVCISEPVTITFRPRKSDEVMAAAVAAIDAQIVEAQQAVRSLEQRKAELLALPAPEAV